MNIHQCLLCFRKLLNALLLIVDNLLPFGTLQCLIICLPVMFDQVVPECNPGDGMCTLTIGFPVLASMLAAAGYGLTDSFHNLFVIEIVPGNHGYSGYILLIFIVHPKSKTGE